MSDNYFKELAFTVRILKDSHTLVSRSYRQLHSSLGSEVKPDNWGVRAHTLEEGKKTKTGDIVQLNCTVHKIWSRSKCFCTHPQSVIINYYQSKFMALVNLVFSSHKHLDHLLANVEGICFRPKCTEKKWLQKYNILSQGHNGLLWDRLPIKRLQLWQRHLFRKVQADDLQRRR